MSRSRPAALATLRRRHRLSGLPSTAVHKRRAEAVLLRGRSRPLGPDQYLVPASWPADHPLYHPDRYGQIDPLLVAETVRQTGILIAHERLGVPHDHMFVLGSLRVKVRHDARTTGGRLPVEVVAECRHDGRDPGRTRTVMTARFQVAGQALAQARVAWHTMDAARYQDVRWPAGSAVTGRDDPAPWAVPAGRLPASRVGRRRPRDVVLAGTESGPWLLHPDPAHPVLFDHPSDHVPGMVLLEGVRQAFAASQDDDPGRAATIVEARFRRFAELDAPVLIRRRQQGFTAEQGGRVLLEATVDGPGPC
ncbi:ScbA/BarX family gamma-butyrolactone biosynthesis protein [Micromonospora sp. WMMD987]|uniref:ScbA/BarX family gamma-butyrolactone biosynthesis protein n=1 Tax=Micromonospora sp. WMMD987 TaxID=3016089 RepID=UPI00249B74D2|nr:ScbA/BarX family gamma-butyrolactone biosynthesis protein [Micromonospora sp. WMMD987]WFE96734.1 ScbA/BarX family gamma-butyrolactone biosynthesis protein [Micromonospora sp. WMMD987]